MSTKARIETAASALLALLVSMRVLTEAKPELALLLLKGLSLKEVATVRAVSERMVREQARPIRPAYSW